MRRAAAAAALLVLLTGCADDGPLPQPGPVTTAVPDPDLPELKADAGVRDCQPGTATDSRLPDLPLLCLGGGPDVNLSSLTGPMIIDIWWSGCTICKEEMPALQEFDQEHGDRVPVLGIDTQDPSPEAALELIKETGATYPQLADPAGETNANSPFPRYVGYPYVLFVDDTGDIAGVAPGGVDSMDELVDLSEKYFGIEL